MSWSVWVVDTVTGVKRQRLPVSEFSWERVFGGGGGSATVKLLDHATAKLDVRALTFPVRNTLVLDWAGTVVYAGLIWERTYDHPTASLTIRHADLWSLLRRRLAIDFTAPNVEKTKQTYTGRSLNKIAKEQMILARTGLANDSRMFRVTIPGGDDSGPYTRTYYGYHLNNLAELLEDIMNEENGPDIDFEPRWTVDDEFDWLMRTGTGAAPLLTGGSWEWNLGAEKSGVLGLTVGEDANKLSTTSYAVGEGMEEDMLVRSQRILSPSFPAIDNVQAHKKESSLSALSSRASGDLATFKQPTTQWGFSVLASGHPAVSALRLGGTAKVHVKGDPWLPDGSPSFRLVGFSGDLSESVSLKLQPGGS